MFEREYPVNPYKRTYYDLQSKAFHQKLKKVENDRITIKKETVTIRLDGYLYKDFVAEMPISTFYIDNELWMSVTPMEVESHFIPIFMARGRVGVAGLGMGYYVQNILDKEEVDEVVVYEIDEDVISVYLEIFGPHEKLTFVKGNVLETCKNQSFDYFYNDIYQNMCDTQAFEDMATIELNNHIEEYHFWTLEAFVLNLIRHQKVGDIPLEWQGICFPFLRMLLEEKENFVSDYLDIDETMKGLQAYRERMAECGNDTV